MTWEILSAIIALCVAAVTLGGVAVRLAMTVSRLDTTLTALGKRWKKAGPPTPRPREIFASWITTSSEYATLNGLQQ